MQFWSKCRGLLGRGATASCGGASRRRRARRMPAAAIATARSALPRAAERHADRLRIAAFVPARAGGRMVATTCGTKGALPEASEAHRMCPLPEPSLRPAASVRDARARAGTDRSGRWRKRAAKRGGRRRSFSSHRTGAAAPSPSSDRARRGSATGDLACVQSCIRAFSASGLPPTPLGETPNPLPFMDLERAANATDPFSPSYTGRRLG